MTKEIIYVIGHKSPDTDTVCSAITYSEFLKKKKINAIAAVTEELNSETKYILDYFKVDKPLKLKSIKGKKVILVDHNENSQSPEGINEAEVIGIIDHHKIGCSFSAPIFFESKPLGSTATLIAQKMIEQQFKITKQLAGLLISAILSDTVIFKSSTTTEEDVKIAKILAQIAGIKNIKEFGIEIKKQKSNLKGMSAEKIIYSDFKIFEEGNIKFGVGQVETVDLEEVKEKKTELLKKMKEVMEKEKVSFLILMLTDIINEGSELLICGEIKYLEKGFNKEVKNDSVYIKKMMSRKKDLVPSLLEIINKK